MFGNACVDAESQAKLAQLVVDETPAIVAYVDRDQHYRFANKAYLSWFGREKNDIIGRSMREVIGSIYELNLPYIQAAIQGNLQVFERKVTIPDGSVRYGLMTYKPNLVDGRVEGFFIHVADVTPLKAIEMELHVERANVREVVDRELHSLRQTNKVLRHFGAICKEVTAQLSMEEITGSLNNHVQQILEAAAFSVYLLDTKQGLLYPIFDQALVGRHQKNQVLRFDPDSCLYRCLTSRQIVIENTNLRHVDLPPNPVSAKSCLMVTPLLSGEEVLGVMSIQAVRENAYGEREALTFKALSTYAANTYINANAYQQLQETKNKLVEQEKMAALGSMVSSLAHSLNTPIGNSLLASTTVDSGARQLVTSLQSGSPRKSEIERIISNINQASELALSNLHRASRLVDSFKLVAVDQSTESLQHFSLIELCQDSLKRVSTGLEAREIEIELDIDPRIFMRSYPHALGLVLQSLFENALVHAFDEIDRKVLSVTAALTSNERLQLSVADNGIGISEEVLPKVFDPFFTTKLAAGCCGLGLNISYNLVLFVLEGQIEVSSQGGKGTCFMLELPLEVSASK